MRLLLFVLIVFVPLSALAGWEDQYGNSLDYRSGYGSQPGQPNYRDSNGTIHYPPSLPRSQETDRPPSTPPPARHVQPRQERYNELEDRTPGNMYKSDSIFHDRVPTR